MVKKIRWPGIVALVTVGLLSLYLLGFKKDTTTTWKVQRGDLVIDLDVTGELKAEKAMMVTAPDVRTE